MYKINKRLYIKQMLLILQFLANIEALKSGLNQIKLDKHFHLDCSV